MEYFAFSAMSVCIAGAIGWPFAHLLVPLQHRQYTLAVAPLFGYAYVAIVCFFLYRLNLGGTNDYAWLVALPPLSLLLVLCGVGQIKLRDQDLVPIGLYFFGFVAMSTMFLIAGGRAVTFGFGNLDIVNYSAISRFAQEFSRESAIGAIGQSTELQRQIDLFWAGPTLFCAFLSSLLGSGPHKLMAISFIVVGAQAPVFTWLIARFGLMLSPAVSIGAGVLCAINPVAVYVLWQSFGAQSVAIPLVLACVFFFLLATQEPSNKGKWFALCAPLVVLLSALSETYQPLLPATLLLLGSYLFFHSVHKRALSTFMFGALAIAGVTMATLALNPWRTAALLQTAEFLITANAGWFHVWLSPERQLGLEIGSALFGQHPSSLVRYLAAAAVAAIGFAATWVTLRRKDANLFGFFFGIAIPPALVGAAFAIKGASNGDLGGYQSFKITASFFALTIIALAIPFSAVTTSKLARRVVSAISITIFSTILLIDIRNITDMVTIARKTSYILPVDMENVQAVETMPFDGGIEISDGPNEEIFWVHYFTLKRKQDFERFAYSGRSVQREAFPYTIQLQPENAAFFGEANLADIFVVDSSLLPKSAQETIRLNRRFVLRRSGEADVPIVMTAGPGFWAREPTHRWMGANGKQAEIIINNHSAPQKVRLALQVGYMPPDDSLSLRLNGAPLESAGPTQVSPGGSVLIESAAFYLPVGQTSMEILATKEPWSGVGDSRTFTASVEKATLYPAK